MDSTLEFYEKFLPLRVSNSLTRTLTPFVPMEASALCVHCPTQHALALCLQCGRPPSSRRSVGHSVHCVCWVCQNACVLWLCAHLRVRLCAHVPMSCAWLCVRVLMWLCACRCVRMCACGLCVCVLMRACM
jgi:hypothetical protein